MCLCVCYKRVAALCLLCLRPIPLGVIQAGTLDRSHNKLFFPPFHLLRNTTKVVNPLMYICEANSGGEELPGASLSPALPIRSSQRQRVAERKIIILYRGRSDPNGSGQPGSAL